MINNMLKIGITTRVINSETYSEKRDAISQDWTKFIEKINVIPIFIPNVLSNPILFIQENELDGLILSGGDDIGFPPERQKTEQAIIEFGMENQLPILGVCRGMQVLNKHFGGTHKTLSTNEHVNQHGHPISIKSENILKHFEESIIVNSYHHNVITKNSLGKDLIPFALSENDKTVEGFSHSRLPIIGVMWHPEREQDLDRTQHLDQLIFNNLFHKK